MPRYHFHIRDHENLIRDEEGLEFADLDLALAEARLSARDMLVDAIADGTEISHQVIEITEPDGTLLRQVHLKYFTGDDIS